MNDPTAITAVSAVDLANLADLERAAWRHYGTACHHDSTPEQRQHLFREALHSTTMLAAAQKQTPRFSTSNPAEHKS